LPEYNRCMYNKHHPDYAPNHRRVVKAFGKANGYQCWLCFDNATGWAWMWRTHRDPANPYSYLPLCRRDHQDYDNELFVPMISAANRGNQYALGHVHDSASKAKMSAKRQGNKPNLGRKFSAETRAKMSAFKMGNQNLLGHNHSEETKAKMSAAHKDRWARTRGESNSE
jgi:NUMOD3 motif